MKSDQWEGKQECPKCKNKISKPEVRFLNYINILENNRQKYIKPYKVDGIDGNIIYEFLGNYYHGNPTDIRFSLGDYNKTCHKTHGELHIATMHKMKILSDMGYFVKYIWEDDWSRFENGLDTIPNIQKYGTH